MYHLCEGNFRSIVSVVLYSCNLRVHSRGKEIATKGVKGEKKKKEFVQMCK